MEEAGHSGQSAPQTTGPRPSSGRRGSAAWRAVYGARGRGGLRDRGDVHVSRPDRNISSSGCYVQTVAWVRLAPGTLVELVFVVKGHVVRARAEARFSESKIGLGLRFVSTDEQMQRRLDGVLAVCRARRGEGRRRESRT